jgi:hypothetical protein
LRQRQEPAIPFHVEHVLPRKHKGVTSLDNLALACYFCNLHKSSNFMGIDPQMRRPTRLFNPRRDDWVTHFRWKGAILIGVTPVGRATIEVLAMNHPDRIRLRKALLKNGDWPGE